MALLENIRGWPMKIRMIVECLELRGYRAKVENPVAMSAEADSREGSIQKLRDLLQKQLPQGTPVQLIEINPTHPWAKFAGTWEEDDPVLKEWEQAVKEYREQMDHRPDIG
jgi:hypothetical protein